MELASKLLPAALDGSAEALQLPMYLRTDHQKIAAIRAKLRFDRTNSKWTLYRMNLIHDENRAKCQACNSQGLESD